MYYYIIINFLIKLSPICYFRACEIRSCGQNARKRQGVLLKQGNLFARLCVLESYHRASSRALIARRNLCARVPRATTCSRRFISVRARFAHNSLMWRGDYFSDFLTLARDRAFQIRARYTDPSISRPSWKRSREVPPDIWEALRDQMGPVPNFCNIPSVIILRPLTYLARDHYFAFDFVIE